MSETLQSTGPAREFKPDSEGSYFSEAAIAAAERVAAVDSLHEAALNGYKGEGFAPTSEEAARLQAIEDERAKGFGPSGFENAEIPVSAPRANLMRKAGSKLTSLFIK